MLKKILIIVSGLLLLTFVFINYGFQLGLVLSFLPIVLTLLLFTLDSPRNLFYLVVIISYFLLGINRYLYGSEFPIGTILDIMLISLILLIIIHIAIYKESSSYTFNNSFNGFTIASLIWLIYVFLEIANPKGIIGAWLVSFRGIALYMFLLSIIVPAVIKNKKDILIFINIWSVLTFIGALKAIFQKLVGFDAAENYWLFQEGGSVTHIIGYGIRYFSFFTDAANFGAQMAMALTVFSILIIYVKSINLKVWYAIVSLLSLYGMLISGTRVALVIPFVGYVLMALINGKVKIFLICIFSVIIVFCFLNYTNIGQSNALVRRMRTALDVNDPSMVVRKQNKVLLKTYMMDKPFGVGLGLAGVKADKYTPGSYLSRIPTDSWFVMLWIETGIFGLILNLLILGYLVGYSIYQILFKIRNELLKGINIALLVSVVGIIVASYANEILGQIPNCVFVYTSIALFFIIPKIDKRLIDE